MFMANKALITTFNLSLLQIRETIVTHRFPGTEAGYQRRTTSTGPLLSPICQTNHTVKDLIRKLTIIQWKDQILTFNGTR